MARRTLRRRVDPAQELLSAAAQSVSHRDRTVVGLDVDVEDALLAASEGGWTMREIAEATGLSAATVYRGIRAAESRQPDPEPEAA